MKSGRLRSDGGAGRDVYKRKSSTLWLRIQLATPLIIAVLVMLVTSREGLRVTALQSKCSACEAVAAELEEALAKERPRNHIDLRHRLDSKGQREGKVIEYRVSELRAVELLDGLCDTMKEYGLDSASSGGKEWIKTGNLADNMVGQAKQQLKLHQKELQVFCERLLEETEDELSKGIRGGDFSVPGSISERLCTHLTKNCRERKEEANLAAEHTTASEEAEVEEGEGEDSISSSNAGGAFKDEL